MPYINVDGTRMYYEEGLGVGQPLLLIHGAAQDTLSWRFNMAFLSKWFRVYSLDLPGHGKSQLAPEGPLDDLETFAVYAEEFMEVLGHSTFAVMGHSMAGGIGLHMTFTTSRTRKLVDFSRRSLLHLRHVWGRSVRFGLNKPGGLV